MQIFVRTTICPDPCKRSLSVAKMALTVYEREMRGAYLPDIVKKGIRANTLGGRRQ